MGASTDLEKTGTFNVSELRMGNTCPDCEGRGAAHRQREHQRELRGREADRDHGMPPLRRHGAAAHELESWHSDCNKSEKGTMVMTPRTPPEGTTAP